MYAFVRTQSGFGLFLQTNSAFLNRKSTACEITGKTEQKKQTKCIIFKFQHEHNRIPLKTTVYFIEKIIFFSSSLFFLTLFVKKRNGFF